MRTKGISRRSDRNPSGALPYFSEALKIVTKGLKNEQKVLERYTKSGVALPIGEWSTVKRQVVWSSRT